MLPVLGSIGTDLRKHDYLVDLGGKIEFRFFAWIWSIWEKIISVFRVDLGKVNFGFFRVDGRFGKNDLDFWRRSRRFGKV